MNNINMLYDQRVDRMEKAFNRQIPDRVPVLSIVDNFAVHFVGYTLSEIIEDDEKHYRAYEKVLTELFWDAALLAGNTRAMKFYAKLGGGSFKVMDSLQVESGSALSMEADEYLELAKNPVKFLLNKVYPRKYQLLNGEYSEDKYQKLSSAVDDILAFMSLGKKNIQRLKEEHGTLVIRQASVFMPLDIILDFLRDFSGTMIDIKRRPQEIVEACDALADFVLQIINDFYPKPTPGHVLFVPLHTPQFLRPKVFEKVYWPSFKKIMDELGNRGYKVLCYFERNWEHLYDYLKELPKNTIVGMFEDDDIRRAKRELGDRMCIVGGMTVHKLMYATREECVDYAKSLIDDLAPGGGYIFSTNMILHNAKDANVENLRAVNEFVRDYAKY